MLPLIGKYVWGSIGAIAFDFEFVTLKGHCQGHSDFKGLISRKGAELGHVLLSDTNRKSNMESPTAPSYFTLGNLVRSKSRSLRL